ncbi:MAG: acetoacetate--CoA ligase, partial [Pseudomonadales bacterium]|nr:acetoacetate--CoA ligase [Pseudomonadales bacterium]
MSATEAPEPLWQPSPEQIARTQLTGFTRFVEQRIGRSFASYAALHQWSIDDPGSFWTLVWEFTGVRASSKAAVAVTGLDQFPGARWFPGARLNFAENLLWQENAHIALIA